VANESFIQIPTDLTDNAVLYRTIAKIVEEIDIIAGNRADDGYVSQSQLAGTSTTTAVSLTSLSTSINEINNTLASLTAQTEENATNIANLQTSVDALQFVLQYNTLDTAYNDFDNAVWGTLKGAGQFSALGSAMTNPPFVVTPATLYIVYAYSITTTGGGVVQIVHMEDTGTDVKTFVRTGDSFAQAVTNGWAQL